MHMADRMGIDGNERKEAVVKKSIEREARGEYSRYAPALVRKGPF